MVHNNIIRVVLIATRHVAKLMIGRCIVTGRAMMDEIAVGLHTHLHANAVMIELHILE